MSRQSFIDAVLEHIVFDPAQSGDAFSNARSDVKQLFQTRFLDSLPSWFLRIMAQKQIIFFIGRSPVTSEHAIAVNPYNLALPSVPYFIQIVPPLTTPDHFATRFYPLSGATGTTLLEQFAPDFLNRHDLLSLIIKKLFKTTDPAAVIEDARVNCENTGRALILADATVTDTLLRGMQFGPASMWQNITLEGVGSGCTLTLNATTANGMDAYFAHCARPAHPFIAILPTEGGLQNQLKVALDLMGDPNCRLSRPLERTLYTQIQEALTPPRQPQDATLSLDSTQPNPLDNLFLVSFLMQLVMELLQHFSPRKPSSQRTALVMLRVAFMLGFCFIGGLPAVLISIINTADYFLSQNKHAPILSELKQFLLFTLITLNNSLSAGTYEDFPTFLQDLTTHYSQLIAGKYAAKALVHPRRSIDYTTRIFRKPIKLHPTHEPASTTALATAPQQPIKHTVQPSPQHVASSTTDSGHHAGSKPQRSKKKRNARLAQVQTEQRRLIPPSSPAQAHDDSDTQSEHGSRSETDSDRNTPPKIFDPGMATPPPITDRPMHPINFADFNLTHHPLNEPVIISMNTVNEHPKLANLLLKLKTHNINGIITGGLALHIVELLFGLRNNDAFDPLAADLDAITTTHDINKLKSFPTARVSAFKCKRTRQFFQRVDIKIDGLPPIELAGMLPEAGCDENLPFTSVASSSKAQQIKRQYQRLRHASIKSLGVDMSLDADGDITLYFPSKSAVKDVFERHITLSLDQNKTMQPEWILMVLEMQCAGYVCNPSEIMNLKNACRQTLDQLNGFAKLNLLRKYLLRHGANYLKALMDYEIEPHQSLICALFNTDCSFSRGALNKAWSRLEIQLNAMGTHVKMADETQQLTALFCILLQADINDLIQSILCDPCNIFIDIKQYHSCFIDSIGRLVLSKLTNLGIDFNQRGSSPVNKKLDQLYLVATKIAHVFTHQNLYGEAPIDPEPFHCVLNASPTQRKANNTRKLVLTLIEKHRPDQSQHTGFHRFRP